MKIIAVEELILLFDLISLLKQNNLHLDQVGWLKRSFTQLKLAL